MATAAAINAQSTITPPLRKVLPPACGFPAPHVLVHLVRSWRSSRLHCSSLRVLNLSSEPYHEAAKRLSVISCCPNLGDLMVTAPSLSASAASSDLFNLDPVSTQEWANGECVDPLLFSRISIRCQTDESSSLIATVIFALSMEERLAFEEAFRGGEMVTRFQHGTEVCDALLRDSFFASVRCIRASTNLRRPLTCHQDVGSVSAPQYLHIL
ncbi:hypothetical protein KCU85_g283, partial [Aureobasidium melanogenum]